MAYTGLLWQENWGRSGSGVQGGWGGRVRPRPSRTHQLHRSPSSRGSERKRQGDRARRNRPKDSRAEHPLSREQGREQERKKVQLLSYNPEIWGQEAGRSHEWDCTHLTGLRIMSQISRSEMLSFSHQFLGEKKLRKWEQLFSLRNGNYGRATLSLRGNKLYLKLSIIWQCITNLMYLVSFFRKPQRGTNSNLCCHDNKKENWKKEDSFTISSILEGLYKMIQKRMRQPAVSEEERLFFSWPTSMLKRQRSSGCVHVGPYCPTGAGRLGNLLGHAVHRNAAGTRGTSTLHCSAS